MSENNFNGDAHKQIFEEGLRVRRAVVGDVYVHRALENGSSEFAMPMQQLVTKFCSGAVWTRPGIERKQRSLINLAMLTALNRSTELAVHVRGAINNGCSVIEIMETLLQASVYCGVPSGFEAFKVAEKVINEMKATP